MNADNGEDVVHGGETEEMREDGGVGIKLPEMDDIPIAADTENNGVEEFVDTAPFGDEDEIMSNGVRDDDREVWVMMSIWRVFLRKTKWDFKTIQYIWL